MHYYIVGSGILGLSVAEYLSFQGKSVSIISNYNSLAGSYAAAANLSTKGQQFARDLHFQLKLEGKKNYPNWIHRLKNEIHENDEKNIFNLGIGIDDFENSTDRDKHLKRVSQDKSILEQKNLDLNAIFKNDNDQIIYKDEAWIDAEFLLNLLNKVLDKRGVQFLSGNFSKDYLNQIFNKKPESECRIILCTGAWTKALMNNLNWPIPTSLNKSERSTIGSTFFSNSDFYSFIKRKELKIDNIALYEKVSSDFKYKVTFSGNEGQLFLSSSSLKMTVENELEYYQKMLSQKNDEILKFALGNEELDANSFRIKSGVRVGYGHSELVVEKISLIDKQFKAYLCCGAHKSGFLFAPVIGEMLYSLLMSDN
jgi:hypothetical protein